MRVNPLEDRLWLMRDFTIDDPTGVLWRIGQNNETEETVASKGAAPK